MENLFSKCTRCGYTSEPYALVCPMCGGDMRTPSNGQNGGYTHIKYNPWTAYVSMFKKATDYRSRSRRSEYWYAYLMDFIIRFIMMAILVPAFMPEFGPAFKTETYETVAHITEYVYMVYTLVILFPQLTLTVRRLHDIGMNGIWAAMTLFPVGSIVILYFMTKDSMPGYNMYGPNPKETE